MYKIYIFRINSYHKEVKWLDYKHDWTTTILLDYNYKWTITMWLDYKHDWTTTIYWTTIMWLEYNYVTECQPL